MNQTVFEKKLLVDAHGRRIRKLRVSLLDACNFRCFYCMPENPKFSRSSDWLDAKEIEAICAKLIEYGLEQIRITGGEPLLRGGFRDIVLRLSDLPIQKLAITTNAFYLDRELDFLASTRCKSINISLDSLSREGFKRITRRDAFEPVYNAILRAKRMGFQVKINTVLMKGKNDHELEDFARFSAEKGIEVRFLEVMKIGQVCSSQSELFISAGDAIARLRQFDDFSSEQVERDSTSFNLRGRSGARIGFIASESRPFCGACSRWRLSANGFLRACLMSERGVKIRHVDPDKYDELLEELLPMKPTQRIHHVAENMNQIGG